MEGSYRGAGRLEGQESLRAILESRLPQWRKSEYRGLLLLLVLFCSSHYRFGGRVICISTLWCIDVTAFSHLSSLFWWLAFGHTSRLTSSILFPEGDCWVNSENTEMDHGRGEAFQVEAQRMRGRLGRWERGHRNEPEEGGPGREPPARSQGAAEGIWQGHCVIKTMWWWD